MNAKKLIADYKESYRVIENFLSEKNCQLSNSSSFEIFDDKIVYNYEVNTSCHCHPVMERCQKEFPISDLEAEFTRYLTDNEEWAYKNEE